MDVKGIRDLFSNAVSALLVHVPLFRLSPLFFFLSLVSGIWLHNFSDIQIFWLAGSSALRLDGRRAVAAHYLRGSELQPVNQNWNLVTAVETQAQFL